MSRTIKTGANDMTETKSMTDIARPFADDLAAHCETYGLTADDHAALLAIVQAAVEPTDAEITHQMVLSLPNVPEPHALDLDPTYLQCLVLGDPVYRFASKICDLDQTAYRAHYADPFELFGLADLNHALVDAWSVWTCSSDGFEFDPMHRIERNEVRSDMKMISDIVAQQSRRDRQKRIVDRSKPQPI